ncbi:MAG: hypothetical protein ACK4OJ_04635 [Brevundimonas sp.]
MLVSVLGMRILTSAFMAIAVGVCFFPAPARACSVAQTQEPTYAERRREARELIEQATAIVDGEVIRPLTASEPALVRVTRILKGDHREFVMVSERTSCDIALTQMGERLRLVLVGGPDVFFLPVDYSNAVQEDRLLRSDRRRDWPYRSGL